MNIAIFSSTIDVTNGYGNITYELCKNLQKKGISFTLFLPHGEKLKDGMENEFPIRRELPPYIFRATTPKVLPYFFANIDLTSFTLVHSLFEFPYAFMAARLAKKYKKPFIMGAQGTYGVLPLTHFPDRYMLLYAYRNSSEIMVASRFTKEAIEQYAHRNFPITILHNGVDVGRFDRTMNTADLRKKYGDEKILLTVGGIKQRKGQDIVIRALPRILEEYPNCRYIIVGEGSEKENFKQLGEELGVGHKIDFVGSKEGEELVKYFSLCDVYVHTPRVARLNFEGFGIVYLEAGASGKPVVATDAGGIRDAVVENETGLIAPDEDSVKVAEYCIKLLQDAILQKHMGEAGRQYAHAHAWPIITDQYIERYQKYSI